MKKTLIVLIAIGAFSLPGLVRRGTAQDSIHYLVMIANQGTQISNQVQALTRMDRHIAQLTGQFEHLKESALGQIGAIADPDRASCRRAHRPAQHRARLARGFHRARRRHGDGGDCALRWHVVQ